MIVVPPIHTYRVRQGCHKQTVRTSAAILTCLWLPSLGADGIRSPEELKHMSLDEVLETKVISVSRTPEDWTSAPSAISILTQEDIRRSGAVGVPDALRLAPGLDVARGLGNGYAITARGFNSSGGNKMQVLMDGRSLYTPLLSGVFWEIQDTVLEDLDRIEVVRGPGGTLWGANAVNGVINIVSKSARDTQGTLVVAGAGTEERGMATVRYGGKLGESTYYRVYGKYENRDEQALTNGEGAADGMQQGQGGFRIDSYLPGENTLTLQGDTYQNYTGILGRDDSHHYGGNVLGRWAHSFSDTSDLQVQAYYDRGVRNVPLQFQEDRGTFDLDAQQHFAVGERNNIVAGGNYRNSADETGTTGTFQFSPPKRTIQLFSGFVQDELTLVPDRLTFYAGTKVEHNDFTGVEWQPSGRLAYTPTQRQTLWAAVSRAVRTPARGDADTRFIPVPATGVALIRGNPDFESEDVIAYELGYRIQAHPRLLVDLATFYNVYDHLRTLQYTPPLIISNNREGETYGVEVELKYQATDWWRLSSSYAWLGEDLRFKPGSFDPTLGTLEANDPEHVVRFRSAMDLPANFEFDAIVRYVDNLPNPYIPSYIGLDLRVAWVPRPDLELEVVGQNILDDRHPEFAVGATPPEVQRGVYGKVTWRF
ncbi:MAG TPA: TonB-dependent receptor [Candidatus Limnocylindria bacterium]|jgi:iron complex outermembrane receptor protein|nr:TonB-dependent receptor [Candidatus Limnocylindria bacterium]